MALFRLPLLFNKKIRFRKLLGCGKNGTFDIHPDWRQWGILTVSSFKFPVEQIQITKNNDKSQTLNYKLLYGAFISLWWKFFRCEVYTIVLQPIEGFGTWDGKQVFGALP